MRGRGCPRGARGDAAGGGRRQVERFAGLLQGISQGARRP
jgi:hypothetical protein